ncbi:MAG: RNA polymerase sigma factor [Sporolactobacillus sp.]
MLKLYHAWKQQPQRHIAKAYVYRIAANMAIDWKRRRAVKEVLLPDPQLAQVGQELLSEELLSRAMARLIVLLPVKQRLLIMLIDGLGCTVQQAASWLGDTRGALTVALHRARRRLHENTQQTVAPDVDEELVSRYIRAFQTASPDEILRLFRKQRSPIPQAASDTVSMRYAA